MARRLEKLRWGLPLHGLDLDGSYNAIAGRADHMRIFTAC